MGAQHSSFALPVLIASKESPAAQASPESKSEQILASLRNAVLLNVNRGYTIFSQGDHADAVFYIKKGRVKLTKVSALGKEAVIGILEGGSFFGESCLSGRTERTFRAVALAPTTVLKLDAEQFNARLREEPEFREHFLECLLTRCNRIEEDLADQLFNSSEKRLARTLLLLADTRGEDVSTVRIGRISQETLAEMVGTTRSRVSFFMNRFRKNGYIKYNGEIEVNVPLLKNVLDE